MPKNRVILLERHLSQGRTAHDPDAVLVRCRQSDPLATVINRVAQAGRAVRRTSPKCALTIMAHGLESQHLDASTYNQHVAPRVGNGAGGRRINGIGGFGIAIGAPPLMLKNVSQVSAWRGLFDAIVLLSCSVAQTHAGLKGLPGDGKLFCRRMASATRAVVFAADVPQAYGHSPLGIDFGAFEGTLWEFQPARPPVQAMFSGRTLKTDFQRSRTASEWLGEAKRALPF